METYYLFSLSYAPAVLDTIQYISQFMDIVDLDATQYLTPDAYVDVLVIATMKSTTDRGSVLSNKSKLKDSDRFSDNS